ncbi:hypothetical protein P7C71_g4476, partial [Lecanoromycetidae sp. Uapishka_2]
MQSDLSFNAYKRYKAGTTKFATWLVEAVRNSGEDISGIASVVAPPVSIPCKGKKNKNNPPRREKNVSPKISDKRHEVPIQEFVRIANIIAKSPKWKAKVPSSILGLLSEVITLRKEVTSWLSRFAPNDESRAQNDTHRYFVYVLEQVKSILKSQEFPSRKKAGDQVKEHTPVAKLSNVFQALSIEEPEDQIDPVTAGAVTSNDDVDHKVVDSSKEVYDVQSMHDEVLIASIFFFQDLNNIRQYLRSVWSDHRAGHTGLMTASILTNTAMELIQRSTKDHLVMIKQWPDAPDEEDFIYWVYAHICRDKVNDREDPDDVINMKTYEQAELVSWPAYIYLQDWITNLSLTQLSFFEAQTRKGLSRGSSDMDPREKLEHDRVFINIMASQMHNAGIMQLNFPPAIDEVTRAFGSIWKTGKKLPLWLTFATQLLLDIQGVLQEGFDQGFETLKATGKRLTATVQHYFRESRKVKAPKESWHKSNDAGILKTVQFVAEWINKDQLSNGIRKHSKQKPEDLGIDIQPYSLFKSNPVLCGLIDYFLNISVQEIGISLTNAYDTIISAAHLYNAVRQTKRISSEWLDMEFLIKTHTPERLFVGGLPTTPGDFSKRYQLALGASALNFAKNGRNPKYIESTKDGLSRRMRKSLPIHDIFCGRYRGLEQKANLSNENVEALLTGQASRSSKEGPIAIYRKQWMKTRKLNSVELLSVLEESLKAEEVHLHFDYISMHFCCAALLNTLRLSLIEAASTDSVMSIEDQAEELKNLESYIDPNDLIPARYLQDVAMPEHYAMYMVMTDAIFLSDPAGVVAAASFNKDAPFEGMILREYCGVSLENVAEAFQSYIKEAGSKEIEKAEKSYRGNAIEEQRTVV